jgi:hypothetical protein
MKRQDKSGQAEDDFTEPAEEPSQASSTAIQDVGEAVILPAENQEQQADLRGSAEISMDLKPSTVTRRRGYSFARAKKKVELAR